MFRLFFRGAFLFECKEQKGVSLSFFFFSFPKLKKKKKNEHGLNCTQRKWKEASLHLVFQVIISVSLKTFSSPGFRWIGMHHIVLGILCLHSSFLGMEFGSWILNHKSSIQHIFFFFSFFLLFLFSPLHCVVQTFRLIYLPGIARLLIHTHVHTYTEHARISYMSEFWFHQYTSGIYM